MIDLREQWAQFLSSAELDKKRKLTLTELEKLKKECYTENLKTSFDHKVYNDGWWNATSTTLDFIPIVGGLKGFIEGCVGKTMSGETLTANEKTQYKLMGVVSLGLDVFTLGTATAAIQGTKAGFKLANAFGKVILTDVAIGWGTKFTSEAMLNIGMSPQLVFGIHMGTNLVVAKHNTTSVKKLKDIEKTLGLKPDQVHDLMKYTGKNLDGFAKAVNNGELDSLLGIPEMNMKYLMKQTGKSADEIADWLKRNDVNLKDINPKNVDDIIKGASGAILEYIIQKTGLSEQKINVFLKKSDMSIDELKDALKTKSYDDILRELNPKTRLPKTNGHWEGNRGEGVWHSDNPKVQAITKGQGIEFKNKRPDLSPWSKGKIEFEPGVLNGSQDDFNAVYDKIMELKPDLKSRNQVKNWLSEVGLTPHHGSTTLIDLIPTDLHSNVPHIGAASDLRGKY